MIEKPVLYIVIPCYNETKYGVPQDASKSGI